MHHPSVSSKGCLERIARFLPPIPEALQQELDRKDAEQCCLALAAGKHAMLAERPSAQLYGPSHVP